MFQGDPGEDGKAVGSLPFIGQVKISFIGSYVIRPGPVLRGLLGHGGHREIQEPLGLKAKRCSTEGISRLVSCLMSYNSNFSGSVTFVG